MAKNRTWIPRRHCDTIDLNNHICCPNTACKKFNTWGHPTMHSCSTGTPGDTLQTFILPPTLTQHLSDCSDKSSLMVPWGAKFHARMRKLSGPGHEIATIRLSVSANTFSSLHTLKPTNSCPKGARWRANSLAISLILVALAFIRTKLYHTPKASPTKTIFPLGFSVTKCLIANSAVKASHVAWRAGHSAPQATTAHPLESTECRQMHLVVLVVTSCDHHANRPPVVLASTSNTQTSRS